MIEACCANPAGAEDWATGAGEQYIYLQMEFLLELNSMVWYPSTQLAKPADAPSLDNLNSSHSNILSAFLFLSGAPQATFSSAMPLFLLSPSCLSALS